jgi:hypothetical protein
MSTVDISLRAERTAREAHIWTPHLAPKLRVTGTIAPLSQTSLKVPLKKIISLALDIQQYYTCNCVTGAGHIYWLPHSGFSVNTLLLLLSLWTIHYIISVKFSPTKTKHAEKQTSFPNYASILFTVCKETIQQHCHHIPYKEIRQAMYV